MLWMLETGIPEDSDCLQGATYASAARKETFAARAVQASRRTDGERAKRAWEAQRAFD